MGKKKTHDEYVSELKTKRPDLDVIGKYVDAKTKIAHRCKIHNVVWDITPDNALHGYGCPQCKLQKIAKSKLHTHDWYVSVLSEKRIDIDVVATYIDYHTKILHRCKLHNVEWMISPAHALRGDGCLLCKLEKISNAKRKSHEQYVAELLLVNDQIVVKGRYKNLKTPILHHCNIHNIDWMISPDCALSGHKCPKCSGGVLKTHEQYVIDVQTINPDIAVGEQYINSTTPILHICKTCGNKWNARPYSILQGRGCPICRETIGERNVRQWLNSHSIDFIYQKTFNDCRDVNVLPFDFYLPQHNVCIEYNGQQHYEPVDFAGKGNEWATNQLISTQHHDKIKSDYCATNNIQLICIPYWEDVNKYLNKILLI